MDPPAFMAEVNRISSPTGRKKIEKNEDSSMAAVKTSRRQLDDSADDSTIATMIDKLFLPNLGRGNVDDENSSITSMIASVMFPKSSTPREPPANSNTGEAKERDEQPSTAEVTKQSLDPSTGTESSKQVPKPTLSNSRLTGTSTGTNADNNTGNNTGTNAGNNTGNDTGISTGTNPEKIDSVKKQTSKKSSIFRRNDVGSPKSPSSQSVATLENPIDLVTPMNNDRKIDELVNSPTDRAIANLLVTDTASTAANSSTPLPKNRQGSDTHSSIKAVKKKHRSSALSSSRSPRSRHSFGSTTNWNQVQIKMLENLAPFIQNICNDPSVEEVEEESLIDMMMMMLKDANLSSRDIAAYHQGYELRRQINRQISFSASNSQATTPVRSSTPIPTKAGKKVTIAPDNKYFSAREPNWLDPTPTVDVLNAAVNKRKSFFMNIDMNSSDDENTVGTMGTTYTTMSCRELSIQRLRRNAKRNAMSEMQRLDTRKEDEGEVLKLLEELKQAEQRQKKLEMQLKQAGVNIAEDIPYEEAKYHVHRIAQRMNDIGSSAAVHPDPFEQKKLREEYYRLEQDMEKYMSALQLTDEWIQEQENALREWENENRNANMNALRCIWKHMPIDIRQMTVAELSSTPTPSGKILPKELVKRFKRTDVLQILRQNPTVIARTHPSTLENMRVSGLTLTERRAIYIHLQSAAEEWISSGATDPLTERKIAWFKMMQSNLKEKLEQYRIHVSKYGGDSKEHPHVCDLVGLQCPVKADKIVDYFHSDYGYPSDYSYPQYEKSGIVAHTMNETVNLNGGRHDTRHDQLEQSSKKAQERNKHLKQHYNGNPAQVTSANRSCELMEELMETLEYYQELWIRNLLVSSSSSSSTSSSSSSKKSNATVALHEAVNYLKRSLFVVAESCGIRMKGVMNTKMDEEGDGRSLVEIGLCEEVYETSIDFLRAVEHMNKLHLGDRLLISLVDQLGQLLSYIHTRNMVALSSRGCNRPARSRQRKTRADMIASIRNEMKNKADRLEGRSVAVLDKPPIINPPVNHHTGVSGTINPTSKRRSSPHTTYDTRRSVDNPGDVKRKSLMEAIISRRSIESEYQDERDDSNVLRG